MHLFQNLKELEENVFAICFTKKSALEMKERVLQYAKENNFTIHPDKLKISTFHALCLELLRQFGMNFKVIKDDEQKSIIKQIIQEEELETDVKICIKRISEEKNKGITAEEFEKCPTFSDPDEKNWLPLVYKNYEKRKRFSDLLDFDDFLLKLKLVFTKHPEFQKSVSNQIKYLIVDEFQDTSELQYLITKYLVQVHQNIFVVGDPHQTIFSFRNANVKIIDTVASDFKDCKVFNIYANYRSSQQILSVAYSLFRNARVNFKAIKGVGERVILKEVADATAETLFIAKKITELVLFQKKCCYSDIAVLARTRYMLNQVSDALSDTGIPIERNYTPFFEQSEIASLLAFVKFYVKPKKKYLDLLGRLFQISPAVLASIASVENMNISKFLSQDKSTLYIDIDDIKSLEQIVSVLQLIDNKVMHKEDICSILNNIIEETNYICLLEKRTDNREERIENISKLLDYAQRVQLNISVKEEDYMKKCLKRLKTENSKENEKVALTTFHSAKGLEWKVCFIVGVFRGNLPHKRSIDTKYEEEEKRLFFVGITRAKDLLYILIPKYYIESKSDKSILTTETCPYINDILKNAKNHVTYEHFKEEQYNGTEEKEEPNDEYSQSQLLRIIVNSQNEIQSQLQELHASQQAHHEKETSSTESKLFVGFQKGSTYAFDSQYFQSDLFVTISQQDSAPLTQNKRSYSLFEDDIGTTQPESDASNTTKKIRV